MTFDNRAPFFQSILLGMLGLMGRGVLGQKVESGTILALMLIQRAISHLIARMYVQFALLAAHEGMQKEGGVCHDLATD